MNNSMRHGNMELGAIPQRYVVNLCICAIETGKMYFRK
jgi:hypothetical protein